MLKLVIENQTPAKNN